MCRIFILADIRPISFHAVVVFGLGKNLLFKYILGRCVFGGKVTEMIHTVSLFTFMQLVKLFFRGF